MAGVKNLHCGLGPSISLSLHAVGWTRSLTLSLALLAYFFQTLDKGVWMV